MPTPPTFDIDALLLPVSDEQPTGPELRESDTKEIAELYSAVRDARKKATENERRLADYTSMSEEERKGFGRAPDPPDWTAVERSGVKALQHSKDLWVTAWLIEGLTREHGLAGLRDGMLLAHRLCEQFWEGLHPGANPAPDPVARFDQLVNRFAQLAGLDGGSAPEGTLLAPIRDVPLTGGAKARVLSFADHVDALQLERKGPDARQRAAAHGAVTLDLFRQAAADSGPAFLQNVIADAEAATRALVDLTTFLQGKEKEILAGFDEKERELVAMNRPSFVPSSLKIRNALDDCANLCRGYLAELFPDAAVAGPKTPLAKVDGQPGVDGGAGAGSRPFASGAIETRQEAFATLLHVSEYFRRAEPHSPVSYALEQAVRWGRMSLPELLSDLVSDRSTREEIFRRAGIIPDKPDES